MPRDNLLLIRRNPTAGVTPGGTDLAEGELGLNIADRKLFAGTGSEALDLIVVRSWSATAQYADGDVVLYQSKHYVAVAPLPTLGSFVPAEWDLLYLTEAPNDGEPYVRQGEAWMLAPASYGTDSPAVQEEGQIRVRTDRDILYVNTGSDDLALNSYEPLTLYVDPIGMGDGFSSGAGALSNMNDAFLAVPAGYNGDIEIRVAAGTYPGFAVGIKTPGGPYRIRVFCERTVYATGTMTDETSVSGDTLATNTDSGAAWTPDEHKYRLLERVTDVNEALDSRFSPIFSNTATVLRLIGNSRVSIGGTYNIVEPAVTFTGPANLDNAKYIDFIGAKFTNTVRMANAESVNFHGCVMARGPGAIFHGWSMNGARSVTIAGNVIDANNADQPSATDVFMINSQGIGIQANYFHRASTNDETAVRLASGSQSYQGSTAQPSYFENYYVGFLAYGNSSHDFATFIGNTQMVNGAVGLWYFSNSAIQLEGKLTQTNVGTPLLKGDDSAAWAG